MNAKRGTIYFAELNGRIKIGFSNNVANRIASLRSVHSSELELIETMDGTFSLERAIHKHLTARGLSCGREWFVNCEEVRETIGGLLREGPAYIGFVPEKPKDVAPIDPMIECVNKIARAVLQVFDGDMVEAALGSPEKLKLCIDLATESGAALERCKAAETAKEREFIAAEFIGRCATLALINMTGGKE